MRYLFALFMLFGMLALLAGTNDAQEKQEKKEVVLKGKITCARCDLTIAKVCTTVIVVKDEKAKSEVIYYFDKPSHEKYHENVCSTPMNGTVEGTVTDDGKKKVVAVKKLTLAAK